MTSSGSNAIGAHPFPRSDAYFPAAMDNESLHNNQANSRVEAVQTSDNEDGEADQFEEEDDGEVEGSEDSDEGSEFNEDDCFGSEPDSNTEVPLKEEEVDELIDKLLVVESKAAEAQEKLEEESLIALKDEVREELASEFSGSELDKAVEDELLTYKEIWQETLDELEDQSGLLQEHLDDAGVDLTSLFKWIEKQAPQFCTTEAWKKRVHWAGLYATEEVDQAVKKAENDLEVLRPVKRHRGKLIEEGASGYLQRKVLPIEASMDGSQAVAPSGDGWETIDSLFGNEAADEKSIGFGSRKWASVYLAATPEQAASLGLPGADQVEEIIDLENCKQDIHIAAALTSEKESGLTELQKKNIKKVGEEDDIKRARLMDRFILKCKKRKKAKVSSSAVTGSSYLHPEVTDPEMGADSATLSRSEGGALPGHNAEDECKTGLDKTTLGVTQDNTSGRIADSVNSFSGANGGRSSTIAVIDRAICLLEQGNQKGLKRNIEDQTSHISSKVPERVIIDIDSDEDQACMKVEEAGFGQEQAAVSVALGSDFDLREPSGDMASKDVPSNSGGLDNLHSKGLEKNLDSCTQISSEFFMCTACGEKLRCEQVYKHPLFDVCICRGCRKFYRSGPISKDINGRDNECSWCGNGGQVIMCELCDKVFCVSCIKRNFGEQEVQRILNAEEWLCYCCDAEPLTPKVACFMEASELCSRQSLDSESSDKEEYIELGRVEKRRKRLRRILGDDELEESTILKQRLEKERKERLERLRESAAASSSSLMMTSTSLEECPINVARDADEEEVLIPSGVAKYLKPHQIEGVRFMWENCIESIKKVKAGDPGNGCILAHNMGLGKTLQVIAFLYTVMKRKDLGLRTTLIVTPVNVLLNWPDEFAKWKPADMKKLRVYVLDETSRNVRKSLLRLWKKTGGVMMIGYSTFRTMSLGKFSRDASEKEEICKALQNPGPDILVCDEAHMIKNKKADITQALKQVRTQRRIALTGSPLQNNLMEYYCMVDFVREGFLGRPQDFKNRFQNPIENGQHADSTEYDVRCMKERTHVLHRQLMGFVQRKGANVVEKELPKKFIYVISVRLSQVQRALYNRFVQTFWLSNEQSLVSVKYRKSLFPTYHALAKVWNHPDLLFTAKEEKEMLSDDSLDDILDEAGLSSDDESKKEDKRAASRNHKKWESDGLNMIESLDWCKDLIGEKPHGLVDSSGKLVLLLDILSMSSARGEKALVFSQSIPTLNLIESFLEKIPRPGGKPGYWRPGKEWYRLDGQTKARDRQKLVKQFNDPCNSKVQCVVISTKAGSLGINLQAANRVIIVDGSWNPTHDIQALFRAWRFGQKKPVVVYRLLAYGTAEEKIYKRQVAKEGLAARVLDAQQVGRHSKMEELKVLFKLDEDAFADPSVHLNVSAGAGDHEAPDDEIMTSLLIDHRPTWIVRLHQHETLLVDREDERLTLEEQALAWEKFRRITESTDLDWVQMNLDGDTSSGPHMQNSWTNNSPGYLSSSCSSNFHVELLRSLAIRNNEHVKCDTCQQSIGWEHIIKGRQLKGLH